MSFFYDNFIAPQISDSYTLISTITYIGFLLLFCFGVLYPYFKKRGWLNFDMLVSIFPYILIGALLRVAEEPYSAIKLVSTSIDPLSWGFWFVTPGIYIVMFLGTFLILHLCWVFGKERALFYFKAIGYTIAGTILLAYLLLLTEPSHFFITLLAIIIVSVIITFIIYKIKPEWIKEKLNIALLTSQAFDGLATYFAIAFFGFGEKHVLSNWVILNIGVWAFSIIKVLLALIIIVLIEKSINTKNRNILNFVRIIISIIGFATGIRDLFSIGLNL